MFVYSLSKSRYELGVPMKIALAYSSPPRHQQNPLSNRNSLETQFGYSPAKVQSYFLRKSFTTFDNFVFSIQIIFFRMQNYNIIFKLHAFGYRKYI